MTEPTQAPALVENMLLLRREDFEPRRPPKVLHLWPPKLLHLTSGDLMH